MSPGLEAHGFSLAYEERGEGPPLLLVHGTGCDRSVWRELLDAVGGGRRQIAYDRRAYGESGAPEPYSATSVEEQSEDAAQLLDELGAAPALVIGHSFGALVALDLLRRRPDLVSGTVAAEPPVLWLVQTGSEAIAELREAVEDGAREAGAEGAVNAYMTAMAGPGWPELLGPERAASSRGHARGLLADLAGTANWTVTRRELKAIEKPIRVITGSRTPAPYGEAARALAELLPNATLDEADAGWLTPIEQPALVARS